MEHKLNELINIYDINHFNLSDLDVLLHETLKHARELLNAEAGTIYIAAENSLKFHVLQNDNMSYEDIYRIHHMLKDFALPLDTKNKYISVDAFITKKIIMVNDIYSSTEYDFIGTKEVDEKFNYKSHSILAVPLIHPMEDEVVGVIQLINKKADNQIFAFDEKDKEIISMLSSFLALSISKAKEDVAKLIQANLELSKSKENLEKIIEHEVKTNQEKAATIFHESRMNSMEEMLTNIAHQWRQPLSTISTIASGMSIELELDRVSKEDAISQLRKIVITTQNLSKTIDDFKLLYNSKAVNERFFISDYIHKVISLSEVSFSINKINVIDNLDKNLSIAGCASEFTQAMVNLITNIKENFIKNLAYTGIRTISFESNEEDGFIYLNIKDNSLTNLKEYEETKFTEIFNISLYMAKLIIQKHFNGEIVHKAENFTLNSENYRGHKYTIIMPLKVLG